MFRKPAASTDSMMQAALMAAIGGNTQEHTEVNTHTQAIVPLIQAVLLSLSILAAFVGLWLLGGGLVALVRSADDRLDSVLAAGLFWIVIAAWLIGGSGVVSRFKAKSGLVARIALLLIAVTGTLATFDVIRLAVDFTWLDALQLLGGLALVIGSSFLVWRFGNELVNPLYPSPPIIRLLQETIHPQEPEPRIIRQPVPVYMNGNQAASLEPPPEPEPEPVLPVGDDIGLLIQFVERAAQIGLGREKVWLKPGAHEHLGKLTVTRGMYDDLVTHAAKWHIVNQGGNGEANDWTMEPDDALDILRKVQDV